nr:hypothetical protein [Candidatus Sigynarchaeota archaeon]
MEEKTIKYLKFTYLVIFVAALVSAITYGVYLALEFFFTTPFPVPFDVFNVIFFLMKPIFRFTYIYCFIFAFPMLVLIQRCERKCVGKENEKESRLYIVIMIAANCLSILAGTLVIFVVDPFFQAYTDPPMLWTWELGTIIIFVAFAANLPHMAGTVNNDLQEFHVWGYHVHESIFGVWFIIAGILFIFNANNNTVEIIFASFFFIAGGFLFGRDLKDVLAGKFIERIPDKKDPKEKSEKRLF